jgi:hypothetical protein
LTDQRGRQAKQKEEDIWIENLFLEIHSHPHSE